MNLFNKIKLNKKKQIILILALSLICLLLVVVSFSNKTSKTESFSNDYIGNLEIKLEETLSKIDGVGKIKVIINVESGMESILAYKKIITENSYGKQVEETPIIVNGQTVVLKEMFPKITGVLIVAEGVKNLSVMSKVQQATLALLDININQIEILSMD